MTAAHLAWMALAVHAIVLLAYLWELGALREMHHGYTGVVLILLSLPIPWFLPWLLMFGAGVIALVDDAWQHCLQVEQSLSYRSPLHRAYALAYRRWAWLRALNRWADARMGRP